jgi:hypothetical protein
MGVLTRNHFGIIAFIEKILHLLNVKIVCQLNALLAVILLHFASCTLRMTECFIFPVFFLYVRVLASLLFPLVFNYCLLMTMDDGICTCYTWKTKIDHVVGVRNY